MVVSGKTKLTLTPWPSYTDEKHILITSDNLLTVADPNPALRASYLAKVGKKEEDFKTEEKEEPQVLLNEEEDYEFNRDALYDDDSYEPNYQEV